MKCVAPMLTYALWVKAKCFSEVIIKSVETELILTNRSVSTKLKYFCRALFVCFQFHRNDIIEVVDFTKERTSQWLNYLQQT